MPENLPRFLTAENAENPISRSPFQRFRFKNYPRNRPMSPFSNDAESLRESCILAQDFLVFLDERA